MHSKAIRLRRPAVWILLLGGLLLAVVAGAAGAYLALKQSGSDGDEGFLAHGQVSAAIFGVDVDTPQSRRCLAKSDQAGTTIRQGIPVTISLNDTAVGVGQLSVGHLTREPVHRGNTGSFRASCLYTFTAPVTEKSQGTFTVDIGTAKVPFSMDGLRMGSISDCRKSDPRSPRRAAAAEARDPNSILASAAESNRK